MTCILKLSFLYLSLVKKLQQASLNLQNKLNLKYVFVRDGDMTSVTHLQNYHVSMKITLHCCKIKKINQKVPLC